MKTSNKWLLSLVLTIFLGTAFLIMAPRMFLGHEPAYVASEISDSEKAQAGDSSVAVVPGDEVNWTRITLGLRRSFKRGIIEDSSIFKEFNLDYLGNSCITGPFFKPLSQKTLCWLRFSYWKKESSSLRYGNPEITIDIWKYKEKPESARMFRNNMAVESLPGIWDYWMYQSARCEWARGRWNTTVSVSLQSCGNDSAMAITLRDKIRDRLFAYYKGLR